ncbi:TPA: hypothetical protein N0F65_002197 [Lagenidium giganteum]|uniref:Leucine-rich repeat domain-containing protein n=1 Tax=Lagenidium giganteum TaxID=4803 RepID=A0AAV2YKE7_9STRA|nr:TPA: hypothetical protein N0F65_002197 [Lagenidium giganteum]
MHVLREAAEVLAQVVQAYWSSNYVSKLAINHALVAILVVNSWSTPLIHALMGLHRMQSVRDQLICRTICLLVDAFLNTSSAVVMPLLVLAPYWSEFNMDGFVFPLDDVYNDAFFAGLVTEAQMIATGKVSGLLLRLIPHLSVLSCCVAIQQFVVTTMSLPTDPVLSSSPTTKSHVHSEKPVWRTVVDFFFGVMGLGVLVIHTYTYARQSMWPADPLCPLVMAPWFASKHACAVYTFDCQHLQRTTPMSGDLAFLEESALIKLNFAHCPAMRMPPDIQRFNNMIGMTIKHLTLVEWSREAAVTPKHHPSLMYVGIGDVNLTEIPAGLLGTLPPLLQDIEITRTNLTTIPDELDRYWGNVVILYIEYSGVSTIPPSLMRLPLFDLSLIGNNITDASVLSGLSPGIGYVSLDHNPLIVMPKAFDAGSDVMVFEFCVESTLVRTVPPELLSSIQTLYMLDTPYCARATTVFTVVDCNASYFASAGKCYIP